jgi:hypothetical protein
MNTYLEETVEYLNEAHAIQLFNDANIASDKKKKILN